MAKTASKDWQRKAHFTFFWAIENTSTLYISNDVESPTFVIQSKDKIKWRLKVHNLTRLGFVKVDIRREEDNGPDCIEMDFELSILASNGSPLQREASKTKFKTNTACSYTLIENCTKVFSEREDEFLPTDSLTFRCRMWRTGIEILKADTCFARTRLHTDKRCFVWAIREFSSLQKGQKKRLFVNSTVPGSPQLILGLFLCGVDENYLIIQIDQSSAIRHYCIKGEISLLDSDGRVVHSENTRAYIDVNSIKIDTFSCFFEKDKIMSSENLLQNDVLFLRCEFLIGAEPEWNRIEKYGYLNVEELEQAKTEILEIPSEGHIECFTAACPFKKAFEDLYGDDSLSDVSIRAGGTLFPAHKNVLSIRSPVFKVMFTQDMREKTSKIVDIPDLNADTLDRLLLYIYKDRVKDLDWESAMNLFRAADKYQLLNLRKKCSVFLRYNLSVYNFCSILLLANMHDADELQAAAEDFISEYDREVLSSNEWENFKEKNSRLAFKITERIILNRRNY
ncbi:unnamed protein product [Larinioides sclopetarius]|uniref:Speckle-type POZ protein n=1 Tax=Larinioides sclopetarius TaxID=280406 RepID=A0AAV2BHJ1_9ARAC